MREIQLSRGLVTRVDDGDFDYLNRFVWSSSSNRYAVHSFWVDGVYRQLKMHRVILGAIPGQTVDHINGDTLDNRRCNLRFVDSRQNNWNMGPHKSKSKDVPYRGVWKQRGRYASRITCGKKRVFLGYFDTSKGAAAAYDAKARELYGEYARLNFPGSHDLEPKRLARQVRITAFGESKTIREWVADPRCSVCCGTLNSRYRRGWDHERMITAPPVIDRSPERDEK